MFSALKEDTMMCSKSVTCNDYMCMVINSVKRPESMGLLHSNKSPESRPALIKYVVCIQSAL